MVVTNNILINEVGEYQINYEIINSRGTKKSYQIKVLVQELNYTYSDGYENNKLVGKLIVDDSNYHHIILPSLEQIDSMAISYVYPDTNVYQFRYYNRFRN